MGNLEIQCPVEVTVKLIGGKWKLVILHQLATLGVKRFNELRRIFPDITQRTLTRQLRELEEDGLVNRKVYSEIPPKVEYSLSETGESLIPILLNVRDWGISYMDQNQKKAEANQE